MIVFVDMEHESARSAPWGEKLKAARTWITYRLEDLAGMHCVLIRYDRVTERFLSRLDTRALFLSGSSASPDRYATDEVAPLYEILASRAIPTFGFCGGMQAMAQAYGQHSEEEVLIPLPDGASESGYTDVDLVTAHPVLDGLEPTEIVRHAHSLQLSSVPDGFAVIGSTEITPIQMIVDDEHKQVGTQFHPEYFTDEHPAGKTMITNFLKWAVLADQSCQSPSSAPQEPPT